MNEAHWNQNPEIGTVKWDAGKRRMSLLPPELLRGVIDVLMLGEKKYGTWNWAKGGEGNGWSRYYDSLVRHLDAFWAGEDNDPESHLHHLDHLIANAIFLRYYTQRWPELDDRPRLFPAEVAPQAVLLSPLTHAVAWQKAWNAANSTHADTVHLATMPPLPGD